MHKIITINHDQYQIGNNHGHINGWTNKRNIYGKVTKVHNTWLILKNILK